MKHLLIALIVSVLAGCGGGYMSGTSADYTAYPSDIPATGNGN